MSYHVGSPRIGIPRFDSSIEGDLANAQVQDAIARSSINRDVFGHSRSPSPMVAVVWPDGFVEEVYPISYCYHCHRTRSVIDFLIGPPYQFHNSLCADCLRERLRPLWEEVSRQMRGEVVAAEQEAARPERNLIAAMLAMRVDLRKAKQFELADRIRDRLAELGVEVRDGSA